MQQAETTETPSSETQENVTNGNTQEAPSNEQGSDTFDTMLSSIKDGERQKYKTVEDALGSINPAQDHIKEQAAEIAELKKKLEQSTSVDALMAKLEEKAAKETPPNDNQSFDESKLSELIASNLSKRDQQLKATNNLNTVIDAFKEKFGDKASATYDQVAAKVGMTIDDMKSLSERSPNAVLQLAGLAGSSEETKQPVRTETQIRTEAFDASPNKNSSRFKMVGGSSGDLEQAWRNTKATINR